jgi:hypothetical protein
MVKHGEVCITHLMQFEIINYLIEAFTKELHSYETHESFRTLSRISLDMVYKIVSKFNFKLNSDTLDNLCDRYHKAIKGSNLLSVTNIDDCQRSTLTVKMICNSVVFNDLTFKEVDQIKDCIVGIFSVN